ncbi:hypothetical protein SAMN05421874_15812 [Nonomuraea maritima]|uniref:Uncharacterized protein n=2 Tax=Nonomuraea maritima TaxID=683260 RepID=A0A1G9SI66_9ACTN|nr:hypothetical protein SAMN05421874_15812 [Nonomuraea maritima]
MRVVGVDSVSPDTVTLVPAVDPGADREHTVAAFVAPYPIDGQVINCGGHQSHRWIDATHTNRLSGFRQRLIRCVLCFADDVNFRDCEIHAMSSTADIDEFSER